MVAMSMICVAWSVVKKWSSRAPLTSTQKP